MSSAVESFQRVRYVERQALSAENLTAEQYARLSARWRHQVAGHDWGIVYGLAVVADARGFTIQTGVAVDGYGRELVLQTPLVFAWTGWDEAGRPGKGSKMLFELLFPDADESTPQSADLWLLWDRQPYLPPMPGRRQVGPGQHTRWLENPRLRVLPAAADLDPRKVNEPEGAEDDPCAARAPQAGPWDNPPDDPAVEWPVFVGRVIRYEIFAPNTPDPKLDLTVPRPYARLRGEALRAVSKLAQMQLGGGPVRSRFSVALKGETGALDDERLVIEKPGGLAVYGETHLLADERHGVTTERPHGLEGDLTIENRPGVTASELADLPLLAEMLVSGSSPLALGIYNGLNEETRGMIERISQRGQATWAQKQVVARGLAQSLDAGLPVEVIDSLKLPRVRALPGGVLKLSERSALEIGALNLPAGAGRIRFGARRQMFFRRATAQESGAQPQSGAQPPLKAPAEGEAQSAEVAKNEAFAFQPPVGQGQAAQKQEKLSANEIKTLLNRVHPGALAQDDEGGAEVWGVTFHPLAAPPAQAAPWQVYHAVVPPPPPPGGPAGVETNQLRIELAHPGDKGDPRLFRFVIGARQPDDSFKECLIVQADGTVIMLGENVLVNGRVLEGPVQADPADPRFGATLVQEALRGVAATTALKITIERPQPNSLVYTVTNTTKDSTFKCSAVFENVLKDQAFIRQGPVGGEFTLKPSETSLAEVDASTLPVGSVVSVLVIGLDQNNKVVEAKNSYTIQ